MNHFNNVIKTPERTFKTPSLVFSAVCYSTVCQEKGQPSFRLQCNSYVVVVFETHTCFTSKREVGLDSKNRNDCIRVKYYWVLRMLSLISVYVRWLVTGFEIQEKIAECFWVGTP